MAPLFASWSAEESYYPRIGCSSELSACLDVGLIPDLEMASQDCQPGRGPQSGGRFSPREGVPEALARKRAAPGTRRLGVYQARKGETVRYSL